MCQFMCVCRLNREINSLLYVLYTHTHDNDTNMNTGKLGCVAGTGINNIGYVIKWGMKNNTKIRL